MVKVFASILADEPVEAWEALALEEDLGAAPALGTPSLVVRGVESQHTEIVVDGEVYFSDILRGGESLKPPAGRRVEVALPDLTRAAVIYNETRVVPLGKLNAGRRLVFIDDVH